MKPSVTRAARDSMGSPIHWRPSQPHECALRASHTTAVAAEWGRPAPARVRRRAQLQLQAWPEERKRWQRLEHAHETSCSLPIAALGLAALPAVG